MPNEVRLEVAPVDSPVVLIADADSKKHSIIANRSGVSMCRKIAPAQVSRMKVTMIV